MDVCWTGTIKCGTSVGTHGCRTSATHGRRTSVGTHGRGTSATDKSQSHNSSPNIRHIHMYNFTEY